MKNTLLLICIALFFSCKDNPKNALEEDVASDISEIKENTLEGAWKLVSYLNYGEDGTVDTILSSETNKQIKMYSGTKVMWSRTRISDSIDWFAYGDYSVKEGQLIEILEYGSKSMNQVIKERTEFIFNVEIGENEFTQIEIDSLGHQIFAENYVRLE